MKNKASEIKKNNVADLSVKKITKDDLWRYRAGRRLDSVTQ